VLALTVASIGFIGKLFTEAIEEISLKQVEAVRATGASFANVIIFAVMPQVFARFVGFATYQLDSNLRNSTMVGIVGAGGIGGTLFSAFQRFDYDFVCTILLTIIAIILLGELLARMVRAILLDNVTFRELLRLKPDTRLRAPEGDDARTRTSRLARATGVAIRPASGCCALRSISCSSWQSFNQSVPSTSFRNFCMTRQSKCWICLIGCGPFIGQASVAISAVHRSKPCTLPRWVPYCPFCWPSR